MKNIKISNIIFLFARFLLKATIFLINIVIYLLCIYWVLLFVSIDNINLQISYVQVLLFIFASFLFVVSIWYLFFSKRKIKVKIIIFLFSILILYFSFQTPAIKILNGIDNCIDMGGSWVYEKNVCKYD